MRVIAFPGSGQELTTLAPSSSSPSAASSTQAVVSVPVFDSKVAVETLHGQEEASELVVDVRVSHRAIIRSLAKELASIIPARLISVGGYFATVQAWLRADANNLLVGAELSNMSNAMTVARELTRMNSNNAAVALASGDDLQLQDSFRIASVSALLPTAFVLVITQTYVLLLPLLGRSNEVCDQVRYYPLKNLPATLTLLVATAHTNFGYGIKDHTPLMVCYVIGGIVMISSYALISKENHHVEGLIYANTLQTFLICSGYMFYLQCKRANQRLFRNLFLPEKLRSAFDKSLILMRQSLQSTLLLAGELLSTFLTILCLSDKTQLAAWQSIQLILTVNVAVNASIETQIGVQTINTHQLFSDNPALYKTAITRLGYHSTWLGSILPGSFFIISLIIPGRVCSLFIEPTLENTLISQTALRLLPLVAFTPLLHLMRSTGRGRIAAFRNSNNPVYLQLNKSSTYCNITTTFLAFCSGLILDYTMGAGALGYVASSNVFMFIAAIQQQRLARRLINHGPLPREVAVPAADNVPVVLPQLQPRSPCSFWGALRRVGDCLHQASSTLSYLFNRG